MWQCLHWQGREAQKMAFLLRENVELKATPLRIFLETGIIPLLLQGLQHLVAQRPSDPVEYLAAFLLKNNPRRDMIIMEPDNMEKNSVVPNEEAHLRLCLPGSLTDSASDLFCPEKKASTTSAC
ncbi:hypothetical protein CY35_03G100400 [Sphagnum magellanicum]|nr:hypothetical protein CY35_03G100400 [Sphagnum magellanicum]